VRSLKEEEAIENLMHSDSNDLKDGRGTLEILRYDR
jgi:hypothetical protein